MNFKPLNIEQNNPKIASNNTNNPHQIYNQVSYSNNNSNSNSYNQTKNNFKATRSKINSLSPTKAFNNFIYLKNNENTNKVVNKYLTKPKDIQNNKPSEFERHLNSLDQGREGKETPEENSNNTFNSIKIVLK